MKRYDDEDDSATVSHLSKTIEISTEEFLKHYNFADFFHEIFEDGCTYDFAVQELTKQAHAQLKTKTATRLKAMKLKARPSLKFVSKVGLEVLAANPSPWNTCKCKSTWAQTLRDEIWERPSKGKGVYKHEKLKPILDWVDAVIVSKGRLANHEAKAKYIELYGEFSSSKAWSSKSRRIRQLLALTSSEEVVLLGNGKKRQTFWWHK